MFKKIMSTLMGVAFLLCVSASQSVVVAEESLADTKIVLQISDPNPFKQTLVLNVAGNLKRILGPDNVDVEIVAFGPGLRLLMADNANKQRIQGLVGSGVRFSACEVTLSKMTKLLGNKPQLNKNAVVVNGGVIRIVELMNKGYKLIKP